MVWSIITASLLHFLKNKVYIYVAYFSYCVTLQKNIKIRKEKTINIVKKAFAQ